MTNKKKQIRHRAIYSNRFLKFREVYELFNSHTVKTGKGEELDLGGPVLNVKDCQNIQRTLGRYGMTVAIPKRGHGENKYYTIYIPSYNKGKIWELFHEFEQHLKSRAQDKVERMEDPSAN